MNEPRKDGKPEPGQMHRQRHTHVFGKWDSRRPEFCAVCDMPKDGWPGGGQEGADR